MSTLTITEVGQRAIDGALVVPETATQSVTFAGTSTQSAVFQASTRYLRIVSDATCSIAIGTNPTAVTNQPTRLAANVAEVVAVGANAAQLRLAVVA